MTQQSVPVGRAKLPVPPRDRRPALAALAILLVVVGALCSALIAYRSGNRIDVLTTSSTIAPGHQMTAADFSVTRIAGDEAGMVRSESLGRIVGTYATTKIPAGALINARMFRSGGVIPPDGQIVGLQLGATQHPTTSIAAGDIVQLYLAPTGGSAAASAAPASGSAPAGGAPVPGSVLVAAARVADIQQTSSSGASGSAIGVSVLLSSSEATIIVPLAAASSIGVTLLSSGTKPGIDYLDS